MKFYLNCFLFVFTVSVYAFPSNHIFLELGGSTGLLPTINYEWLSSLKTPAFGIRGGISAVPFKYYDSETGYQTACVLSIERIFGKTSRKWEAGAGYAFNLLHTQSTHDIYETDVVTQVVNLAFGARWKIISNRFTVRAIFQPTVITNISTRNTNDFMWHKYESLQMFSGDDFVGIPLPWGAISIGYEF